MKDYDDAIEFYTQKLDFTLLEDTKLDAKKRWVMTSSFFVFIDKEQSIINLSTLRLTGDIDKVLSKLDGL